MFISMLSLRMGEGGGTERAPWQDWLCVWWMGLSQTVTGLCSIHVDVQYALHPVTSWEPFCPDNLHIVSSLAAYGGCGHWGVFRGRRAQTVDPLEAKMGHEVDWCAKVVVFLPLLFLKSLRVGGKFRLEFLPLQTFLRPCLHSTLQCIWGDLITC